MTNPLTQPQARFTGAPALHPQAQPARVVEMPRLPVPAPLPDARLTIRPDGRRSFHVVTLTKCLLLAIPHLKGGAPVDVVPPARRGGPWYLDTRATAPRRLRHSETQRGSVARFSIPALSREHLLLTAATAGPGRGYASPGGTRGTVGVRESLGFALGGEVPGHPGYFELLPLG